MSLMMSCVLLVSCCRSSERKHFIYLQHLISPHHTCRLTRLTLIHSPTLQSVMSSQCLCSVVTSSGGGALSHLVQWLWFSEPKGGGAAAGGGANGSGAGSPSGSAPPIGGLFTGGVPKLRPVGGQLLFFISFIFSIFILIFFFRL